MRSTSSRGGAAPWRATLLVVALSAVPLRASADDRPAEGAATSGAPRPSGLRVGLRTGMALPVGKVFAESGPISDTIVGYVPVRVDLGYRLERHLYLGVAVELARVLPSECPRGGACSGSHSRFGVVVAYHFVPTGRVDPWLGAGMGFEDLSTLRSADRTSVDVSARGLELLDIELGADLRPSRALRFGPVVSSAIGRYTVITVNGTPTRDFDRAMHAWMTFGLRAAIDL